MSDSRKTFSYDIFTLIECIESKPCLWDKSLSTYKDKIMRRNAWNEVAVILEPEFETFEMKKKTDLVAELSTKWNNVRDAFMRSLKTKSGQAFKKNYIYANNLKFLLKIFTPEETVSSIPDVQDTQDPQSQEDIAPIASTNTQIEPTNVSETHRKKRMNPLDVEILKVLQQREDKPSEAIENDEDKAFLFSILPAIRRLSEDEKLSFKIQVMQLIQKYTKNLRLRRNSMQTDSINSHSNQNSLILDSPVYVQNQHNQDQHSNQNSLILDSPVYVQNQHNQDQDSIQSIEEINEQYPTESIISVLVPERTQNTEYRLQNSDSQETERAVYSISELLNQDFENM